MNNPKPGLPVIKKTKASESRVITIPRFETFLYELHCILRNEYPTREYPALEMFLKKYTQ